MAWKLVYHYKNWQRLWVLLFSVQTMQLTITLHHNGQSMRLDKLASLLPYTRFFLIESQTELILSTFVGIVPVVPWLCSFACFTAIRSEFGVTNGIITMYLFIQIIVKALSVQNSTQSTARALRISCSCRCCLSWLSVFSWSAMVSIRLFNSPSSFSISFPKYCSWNTWRARPDCFTNRQSSFSLRILSLQIVIPSLKV